MKSLLGWLLTASIALASQNAIGSKGYYNITTPGFVLELDVANQVATRLIANAGSNAGPIPFSFLLPTASRTDDGNYFLGDIQLRFRAQNTSTWTDAGSSYARQAINGPTPGPDFGPGFGAITSSDITSSLGQDLPLSVNRTWSEDGNSIVMTFNITNTGNDPLEFGGVGIPLPFNDDWTNEDQQTTWETSAVSDPAISLDAGYVITNRLTGNPPTLLTIPVNKTPLEQYRLNYNSEPGYPAQWLDSVQIGFEYEGIYSWWMASAGLQELDDAAAAAYGFILGRSDNIPTSFILQPQTSRIVGLRFYSTPGPEFVEEGLAVYDRPTITGVPGFVAAVGDTVKLVINSTAVPSISDVAPANIQFGSPVVLGKGLYSLEGTVSPGTFGRTRVTIAFSDGSTGTAHYSVVNSPTDQMNNLGKFRFTNQWYSNTSDYFHRGPSIITYDNKKKQQVLDDPRVWVAGLSDEAGTGAYVSAAAKQLGRPDVNQVRMLEQFATQTLWSYIQISTPGATYGGVKKSLFYYDSSLEGQGIYQPGIDHTNSWPASEANRIDRSYDYPHATIVYWVLYRLARNYKGYTTVPWTWYIDRAYDTIIGMQNNAGIQGYAQFGLMEGTYFQMVLEDMLREGTTNSTLASRAQDIKSFMKQRADLWNGQAYPYASEFPWDNTAQEEVYAWTNYFGYNTIAQATIKTLIAIMPSVPHWGYSGAGRDLWDFLYSAENGPGARIERCLHHYKGAQSTLPLMTQYMANPTDIKMLRAGYGGVLGSLTTIGSDGFGSTGFHSRPDYLAFDPLSGDNGVNIALHALSTRAVAVNDATLGGWAGFGAAVSLQGTTVEILPRDSFQQRVFIADNALYLELDAGHINNVTYETSSGQVEITFDADDGFTPYARLRWSTTASTAKSGNYTIQDSYSITRGASVIPLTSTGSTIVTLNKQ